MIAARKRGPRRLRRKMEKMGLLNRLRIEAKLALLLGLSALSLLAAIGVAASLQYQRMIEDRKSEMRAVLDSAISIADGLQQQEKAGKLTHDLALARFREIAYTMWYQDKTAYLFAYTMDGTAILNAANPKLEGIHFEVLDHVDELVKPASLAETVQRSISPRIIELRTADEIAYLNDFPRPGQTEALPKLSLVRKYLPWNMLVGTGLWIDDVNASFRANLEERSV